MGFWIFMAGIESSLLMVNLKTQIFENIFSGLAVFYLLIQINSMLFCFDYNLRTFIVQLVNIILFSMYIHFSNVELVFFCKKLLEIFIIEYIIVVLILQVSVVSIWRKYLKI